MPSDVEAAGAKRGVMFDFKGDRVPEWVVRAYRRQAAREAMARRPASRLDAARPITPVITARPRERRPSTRRRTASRDGPDEPPLDVIPPAEFRRAVRDALAARALLAWSRSLGDAA
jgi:hypothetical protein